MRSGLQSRQKNMSKPINVRFVITFLTLLIFHSIQFCVHSIPVKGIDLNRPPAPEPMEKITESKPPAKINLPDQFYIKRRKSRNDKNSPGFQARKIANESGHVKNSKEYHKVYQSHYFKIRREQGSKFYEGLTKDPDLSLTLQRKNRTEIVRKFMRNVQSRKRTNQLTPADERYYENARKHSKEMRRLAPELVNQRKQASVQKMKLLRKGASTEEPKDLSQG